MKFGMIRFLDIYYHKPVSSPVFFCNKKPLN